MLERFAVRRRHGCKFTHCSSTLPAPHRWLFSKRSARSRIGFLIQKKSFQVSKFFRWTVISAARDRNEIMGELFQFASVMHVLFGKLVGWKEVHLLGPHQWLHPKRSNSPGVFKGRNVTKYHDMKHDSEFTLEHFLKKFKTSHLALSQQMEQLCHQFINCILNTKIAARRRLRKRHEPCKRKSCFFQDETAQQEFGFQRYQVIFCKTR